MNRFAPLVLAFSLPTGALAQKANDPLAQGDLARAHGDLKGALAAYTQATAQNPKDPRAYILRGTVRAKLGDSAGAIADDTAALVLDPKSAIAYTNRANARAAAGDLAGAQADYTQALGLDPGHAMAYLNRANVEAMRKNYAAALPDYNAALALQPQNALALYDRAGARRAVGKYAGAIADYSQVLLLDPHDVRAWLNRAVVRMAQRDWSAAASDLQKCVSLLPPDRQIYPRLYLWVVRAQQQHDPNATPDLLSHQNQVSPAMAATWPGQIESYCAGKTPDAAFLAAAQAAQAQQDRGQLAQAYYYAGLKQALAANPAGARAMFENCVAAGDPKLHEVVLAREELREMGAAPP